MELDSFFGKAGEDMDTGIDPNDFVNGIFILLSWPENQGIFFFFYISQTLQMNRISFMAFLLNAVL